MKHRIFVAIPISEELQVKILEWEKQWLVATTAGKKATADKIRWLAGKNLHITLIPPWYVSESELEKVKSKMEKVSGIGSLELKFEKVEYGPNPKSPRLIWAAGPAPKRLLDLKLKIENFLGAEPEKRPFRLHLTLARFWEEGFPAFSIKNLDELVSWKEKVSYFVLMESYLSRTGADYEVLKTINLA